MLFVLLLSTAAFFSASEYAIVKIRTSRIDQLIEEGHRNAPFAKRVVSNVDDFLSACQIGFMISALGLGWLGHGFVLNITSPLMERLNLPELLADISAFLLAFFFVLAVLTIAG